VQLAGMGDNSRFAALLKSFINKLLTVDVDASSAA
jgi:hypothetical protein